MRRRGVATAGLQHGLVPVALCLLLGASAADGIAFTDATSTSGLGLVQQVLVEPPSCLLLQGFFCEPERMTGGAAAGDLDGDGHVDLVITRIGASDALFLGQGDGRFVDATAGSGLDDFELASNGVVFADVDKDGDLDLYLTSIATSRFHLFINDGAGHFSEEAEARGAQIPSPDPHVGYGVGVGDVNRDGYPDLFVAEWRPLAFSTTGSSHSRLLVNRGHSAPGHFEDRTADLGVGPLQTSWNFAPAIIDLDDDGWQDVAIAGDFGTSQLYWNQGDGTFQEDTSAAGVGGDENGMGSTFGDWDGDGHLDWFVTSIYDPADTCSQPGNTCAWGTTGNRLYRNRGDRSFEDATDAAGVRDGAWGWGAAFFDPDNDGDEDLVMTNGFDVPDSLLTQPALDDAWEADAMRFWRNDGGGPMVERGASVGLADTGSGKGLLIFDPDEDGDQDVLVINNGSGPLLLVNTDGSQADFLRVSLTGHSSTTSGFGAVVEIQETPGGPIRKRVIGATSHFLAQSERVAHFGLGSGDDPVHLLQVRWPSGVVMMRRDVPRRTHLHLEERPWRCGLLGVEALVPLGLAAAWRGTRHRARRVRNQSGVSNS